VKNLLYIFFIPFLLFAKELDYKGNIVIKGEHIEHSEDNKKRHYLALGLELELKKKSDIGLFALKAKSIFDIDDKNRRYVDFNDLYYKFDFADSDLLFGRNVRFWGALEFYNLVDVFNSRDLLDDPYDFDSKLGSWNIAYTKYFDNNQLSLIVKLKEQKQEIQNEESINNSFTLPYSSDFNSSDKNRPTLFLKYSGSASDIEMDYGIIYQNGYDLQRYITLIDGKLTQNLYIVNKLLGYSTYISGDTIYKIELSYATIDNSLVSDYLEYGVGFEQTFYSVWEKRDLGVLVEYYRYKHMDDSKLKAKDFGKLFDNDLTLGFRLSLNDSDSSEVLGGIDIDMNTKEKIYFAKYETRVYESFTIKTTYQHTSPANSSPLIKSDRLKLDIGYYF
jgi:hypothetical protein